MTVQPPRDADKAIKEIHEAADHILIKTNLRPRVAVILGTGLSGTSAVMETEVSIPYGEIPHFPVSTAEGHAGILHIGRIAGVETAAMEGRFHLYEGYTAPEIAFAVRALFALGINTLIITNSAGGLNPLFRPGEIMVIHDQINFTGRNPLVGPNLDTLGPRFPDMTKAYDRELIEIAEEEALRLGIHVNRGVYIGVLGPSLETAAETRMFRGLGADALGMSTVMEVITAAHVRMRVLGFSLVANVNLPDAMAPILIDDIIATGEEDRSGPHQTDRRGNPADRRNKRGMTERIGADVVISGGIVLTMEDGVPIEDGAVVVVGDAIAFVGKRSDAARRWAARTEIDATGCVVMPGLVNGHTHAAMSLFRGIADDLPLERWLCDYIFPAEKANLDDDFVYWGTKLACAEMLLGGVTTFCDMYLFEDSAARAAKEMGMRGVLGEVLYDFPSPNYGPIEKGFEYTENFIKKWQSDPLIVPSIQPHALDTCSPELFVRAKEISDGFGVRCIVHVAESRANIEDVKKKHGKSSFEYLDDLGVLNERFTALHAVWVDDAEMEIMRERNVTVVTNPESNMKLASGWAPVHKYLGRGIVVGLGTDGCASNNDLDLFGEMDTLAKLHKVYDADPTHMEAKTVLQTATKNGARALGLGELVGTLAVGKKADLIIVDFNKPHLTPVYNPYSHLVYAAKSTDVRDVLVNGDVLVHDGKLTKADAADIMAKARELSGRVRKSVG